MTATQKLSVKESILYFLTEYQVREDGIYPRGEMYSGYCINDDDSPAFRYCDLTELGYSLPTLRNAMRELRNDGLVELVTCIDSVEEKPCGSGWTLTDKGLRHVVDNLPEALSAIE